MPLINLNTYTATKYTCYLGYLVQCTVQILSALLFIPLREEFGLSYTQLGALTTITCITQVVVDIAFSKPVEKYGYRVFAIVGNVLVVIGRLCFAIVPYVFKNSYPGFIVSTLLFSIGGGMIELLLSPIVSSIPAEDKSKSLSMLHAVYSISQFFVVLITAFFIYCIGAKYWTILVGLWTIPAVVCGTLFYFVPLCSPVAEHHGTPIEKLIRRPKFIVYLLQITIGTAAEMSATLWISTFVEGALHVSKLLGDSMGLCIFAITHGSMRVILGHYGEKMPLKLVMIGGSISAFFCFIVIAVSPYSWLSVVACGMSGFGVSLLWPGTLILATNTYPKAGAGMFAFLAAFGYLGGAIGSQVMGLIADGIKNSSALAELAKKLGLTPDELGLRGSFLFCSLFGLLTALIITITQYCMKDRTFSNSTIEAQLLENDPEHVNLPTPIFVQST